MITFEEYLLQARAALIKQEKALQEQRAGVIQQIRVIEKALGLGAARPVQVASGDSVAGIISVEQKGD